MAQDDQKFSFAKLNFFNRLDARARVFFLFGGLLGVVFLVYLGTKLLSGPSTPTGTSRVAGAPAGLKLVPGGEQSAAYNKVVEEANLQRAKAAQLTGATAVPTLQGTGQPFAQGNQCIICSEQAPQISDQLDAWVKQGKVTPDVVKRLEDLASQNIPETAFADELNELVKQGKLTPEQARLLLEQYHKQHANALLKESAKSMDELIKSGAVPIDVANQLLQAQKDKMSPSDYAAMLQQMARDGKISPQAAQQLLTQYSQQHAKEVIEESIAFLRQMARRGEITPDVEKELVDLENRMVPLDVFSSTLQKYLATGKIAPIIAKKIEDEFKAQKAAIGPLSTIHDMVLASEAAAYKEISDLLQAGKITQEVADQLRTMIQKRVSLDEFTKTVNAFVQQNKLTREIAALKLADYRDLLGKLALEQNLGGLQSNNATPAQYAEELKRMVQAGVITPEQAAALMQEYQAAVSKAPVVTAANVQAETAQFAELQKRLQAGGGTAAQPVATASQFTTAQTQVTQQSLQAQQERIQNIMTSMSDQAQSLIASWQPVPMEHKAGTPEKPAGAAGAAGAASATSTTSTTSSTTAANAAVVLKAGTILFAVLDTEANSDYPDSPIMATVIDGPYKGAKLMGKLVTTKGVSGQMDRITLNFTIMNTDDWPRSKTVSAYGVDPDTARTVLASSVNYHYIQRFGAIMATSFLQGYATSITNAGTSTTGIFGTSTTHPSLSPSNKIAVGLGQVGTALGNVTQNYVNIPPTVKVDSGVGLGILFMSDVT